MEPVDGPVDAARALGGADGTTRALGAVGRDAREGPVDGPVDPSSHLAGGRAMVARLAAGGVGAFLLALIRHAWDPLTLPGLEMGLVIHWVGGPGSPSRHTYIYLYLLPTTSLPHPPGHGPCGKPTKPDPLSRTAAGIPGPRDCLRPRARQAASPQAREAEIDLNLAKSPLCGRSGESAGPVCMGFFLPPPSSHTDWAPQNDFCTAQRLWPKPFPQRGRRIYEEGSSPGLGWNSPLLTPSIPGRLPARADGL